MHKDFPAQFIKIVESEKTFALSSWVDEAGYPKIYENNIITSVHVVEDKIPQSMYMGKNTLHMGIEDDSYSRFSDVSLAYNFIREELYIDYTVSTFPKGRNEPVYLDSTIAKMYGEEEYFQQSTIENLPFSYDELIMMKNFFDAIKTVFLEVTASGKYARNSIKRTY